MAKRGISLLDLATPYPGSQAILPDELASRLENLAVISHRATTSAGAQIHAGVVQPISDLGFPSLRNWPVEVPGLNTGLPFRLVRTRTAPSGAQNLEPGGAGTYLDLIVDRIAITVPGLKPAILQPAAPASAAHLLPDTSRSGVKIVGSGVVRIDLSGSGGEVVRFVDWPDPFDPHAPSGAVYRITFDPISFFFGESEIGMVVDRLVIDASSEITPPEILARGQTPGWQGISIAEATLLLPPNTPLVDKINIGVKDVLLGSPAGLQGEIQIELGRTPIAAAAVAFLQDYQGTEHSRTVGGSGRAFTVPFVAGSPNTGQIRAKLDPSALGASTQPQIVWTLPDGSEVDENDSGWFTASIGQSMQGQFSEEVNGDRVNDRQNTYTFVRAEGNTDPPAPISVHTGATDIANVVAVSGSASALAGLDFESALNPVDAAGLRWQYGAGSDAPTRSGADFTLDPAAAVGTGYLVVTDSKQRTRRIRVDVLADGPVLIGAEDGVHDAAGALVAVRGVEGTYRLDAFHRDGSLTSFTPAATASGTSVTVQPGGLAAVTIAQGAGTDPTATPPPVAETEARHLQVQFEFDTANPTVFGALVPRTQQGTIAATVQAWAQYFPGATFLAIGRCCDLGTDDYNAALGTRRSQAAAAWLAGSTVMARGEQTPAASVVVGGTSMTTIQAQAITDNLAPPAPNKWGDATRLILQDFSDSTRQAWGDTSSNANRVRYRRVDIYAVGGTYTAPAGQPADGQQQPIDTQQTDPGLRRSLVPGADAPAVAPPDPPDPRLGYLIRLVVAWDSPTVTSWADAIPTKAEFTVEWATSHITSIPPSGGGSAAPVAVRAPSEPAGSTSTEVYTLTGSWAYDSRSGQTVFSLSIESSGDPKGLVAIDSEFLAIALALAPALLAGIGASGVDGAAVRLAALAIAAGVLSAVAKDGEVVIHKAEVEHRQRSLTDATGFRTRILLDYTAAVGFDIAAGGLGSLSTADGHPLKVTYKKVGLEFDDSKTEWYEKLGLVFDDVSFEVADPGRWKIDGALGQLLQIAATRAGVGSSWFECDLEFALDLGVVSIEGATVRVTFGDSGFSAELRGLALSVEIPGVLKGSGRVVLGDGGAFKAALELDLISVGAKAMGALAFDPATDFLSIALGLILPVGIPLGATGLGIFGFLGMFVSNGARALPSGFDNDPVGREIAWYRDTPYEDKFAPERGQWAIGLGMIVGTMPDQAFTFNAMGMFVVAFPDPAVIFGIDAKLIQQPSVKPQTQGDPPSAGLNILGLVVVDEDAVIVAVRGSYEIPKVLKLTVPIDGYFPTNSTGGDAYMRIGSDGVVAEGRPGDPVTIQLLPGTLDMKAFAYLMVEENKLHRLGNDPEFNFDGFSIGFGAGFEIKWSAGPIKLEASALILVGFGTDPFLLKGGIMVHGELDLVILTVAADGRIVCTVWDDGGVKVNLKGQFCGSVSCFFFTIKGCVSFEVGDSLTPSAPPPKPPIGKVSLTDRRGFTTALAGIDAPGEAETVWPDTVPVIEFTHHLAVDLSGSAFQPGGGPAGPVWSGTTEMKYAYRLTGVTITPDGGSPLTGPLDSGWWLPTSRPGVLTDGDVAVSESEGMFLALLAWDPAPWSYWLTDGGAGIDGDPATTPGRLCDPPAGARPSCAWGKAAQRTGVDTVTIRTEDPGAPPFPSRFAWRATEQLNNWSLTALIPLLAARGWALTPGQVGAGPFGEDVFWLPLITDHSFTIATTEFTGPLDPEITDGELLLVICRDFRKRPGGKRRGQEDTHDDNRDNAGDVSRSPLTHLPLSRVPLTHGPLTSGPVSNGPETGAAASAAASTGGHSPIGPLPWVESTTSDGKRVVWEPKILKTEKSRTGMCQLVSFRPSEAGVTTTLTIHEWVGTGQGDAGRVGVVRLCGVTAAAANQAAANAQYAVDLTALINTAAAEGGPARKNLLAANTGYTVTVNWQWQGWVKSDSSPAPPSSPPDGDWIDGDPQDFRFRTAAHAVTVGNPPAELTDEQDFDPRALQRYLIGFEPDTHSAPHLLDDKLLVHLAVDHGDQLAGLYDRHLQLRLRRTDPPPGSMAGAAHPDGVPLTVDWGALYRDLRPIGQARFLDAIDAAPCLSTPPLGGTTGSVTADLVPGAWYDLILLATPTATPDAEDVVISRSHFQASRYRNETDLAAALGFSVGAPAAFLAPDAIVTAGVPAGSLVIDDAALDSALAATGLDPWALSPDARTSILWLRDGTDWKLAGLLLEAPEAVVRAGRTALDITGCSYGPVTLTQRFRTVAGTRVLLAPPAPIAVPTAERITLTLTRTVTAADGTSTSSAITALRSAIGIPRVVLMEAGA